MWTVSVRRSERPTLSVESHAQLVGEAAARRLLGRELERRASRRGRGSPRPGPRQDPREAVYRRIRLAPPSARTRESRPARRRGSACRVRSGSRAHPQHRPLAHRLEVGDVAAVEEDVGLALGRFEPQPVQATRTRLEADAIGEGLHGAQSTPRCCRERSGETFRIYSSSVFTMSLLEYHVLLALASGASARLCDRRARGRGVRRRAAAAGRLALPRDRAADRPGLVAESEARAEVAHPGLARRYYALTAPRAGARWPRRRSG